MISTYLQYILDIRVMNNEPTYLSWEPHIVQ